jgi:metal-responsive CopG/Arc/MetJ family transcriptional regulator
LQRTIKKKTVTGNITCSTDHKELYKNTSYREKYQKIIITRKQGTIEEILIRGNNAKIQLIRNNTRNNNHKEQYQNTTYREQ